MCQKKRRKRITTENVKEKKNMTARQSDAAEKRCLAVAGLASHRTAKQTLCIFKYLEHAHHAICHSCGKWALRLHDIITYMYCIYFSAGFQVSLIQRHKLTATVIRCYQSKIFSNEISFLFVSLASQWIGSTIHEFCAIKFSRRKFHLDPHSHHK